MTGAPMKRRSFLTLLGAAAASSVSWPLAARAQQDGRVRRIAVLSGGTGEKGTEQGDGLTEFKKFLEARGWIEGRNAEYIIRFGSSDRGAPRQMQRNWSASRLT